MKKRKSALLLAAVLTASLLTACSPGAQEGQEETAKSEGEAQEKTFIFGDTTFNAENGEADINPHKDSGGWPCIRYGVGRRCFVFQIPWKSNPGWPPTIRIRMS